MSGLTSDNGAQREDAGGGVQPEGGRPFGERHRWVRGGIGGTRSFLFLFGCIEARNIYWEAMHICIQYMWCVLLHYSAFMSGSLVFCLATMCADLNEPWYSGIVETKIAPKTAQ